MERPSISHRVLFTGFALSLAIGFALALYIHGRYVQYKPVALHHVPQTAHRVYRLNIEQAVVRKPLVEFVLPLFERGRTGPESRKLHLERKTKIELDVDVRELVLAELPSDRWLLVAAGLLRPKDVADGVGRMLKDEGIPIVREGGLLIHPSGLSFGVAEDGSLILASDKATAGSAISATSEPSWAPPLRTMGLALSVFRSPGASKSVDGRSHLRGGVILVEADSHFPLHARLHVDGQGWSKEQGTALLESKKGDVSYLIPFPRLHFLGFQEPEIRARGNLGREEFDTSVGRFAGLIRARLENTLSSQK